LSGYATLPPFSERQRPSILQACAIRSSFTLKNLSRLRRHPAVVPEEAEEATKKESDDIVSFLKGERNKAENGDTTVPARPAAILAPPAAVAVRQS
jgi:hypothetical protein